MPVFNRSNKVVFAAIGFILLNCAFIQGIGQPPTPTPTATATNTPIPTETATQMEPVFPTEDDLVDTRWTLVYDAPQDGHREYDIIFHAGGRLESFHPNDRTPDNDTWKLVGAQITLCMNDCFAVYTGEFIDTDTMAGTTENTNNESWEWTARRKVE